MCCSRFRGWEGFAEGVITAESDQLLLAGALDAETYPNIYVNFDKPIEDPTKVGTFHSPQNKQDLLCQRVLLLYANLMRLLCQWLKPRREMSQQFGSIGEFVAAYGVGAAFDLCQ